MIIRLFAGMGVLDIDGLNETRPSDIIAASVLFATYFIIFAVAAAIVQQYVLYEQV